MGMASVQRYALPPGIYVIQSGLDSKVICNPDVQSENLYLSAVTTPTEKHMWQIGGNGLIASMESAEYSYVLQPSFVNAAVVRNSTGVQWIINVKWNFNQSYTGFIMTSDTKARYWGAVGNDVFIQDSPFEWTFTSMILPMLNKFPAERAIEEADNPQSLSDSTA